MSEVNSSSVYLNTVKFPQQVFLGLIHDNLFLHSDCSDYLEANQMNGVRFLAGINWHSSLILLHLL